jgi:hypothetical protein
MRNLQDATERICELKGGLVALDALLPAVIDTLSAAGLSRLTASFDAHAEVARTLMLNSEMSDVVLAAFEREVARNSALLRRGPLLAAKVTAPPGLDPLLLTTTRVSAFVDTTRLCRNTGFFFRRGGQLFLVSTRQTLVGQPGTPPPDRIDIELPIGPKGDQCDTLSFPLHPSGSRGRCGSAADVDVAVMTIDKAELPASAMLLAFDESHLEFFGEAVGVGDPVSTVSFPLGNSARAHRVPLARSGAIASSFGLCFEDTASFLTDMHSHPESRGSAVVRRRTVDRAGKGLEGWQLIGIHSHDAAACQDGASTGLHRAWYADVLMSLSDAC